MQLYEWIIAQKTVEISEMEKTREEEIERAFRRMRKASCRAGGSELDDISLPLKPLRRHEKTHHRLCDRVTMERDRTWSLLEARLGKSGHEETG